ncbi:J domain-containing protein [Phormidesmis priestleyi ULC007]|uniref:J domain-containing protein n=1 Tax=Phormidesmis priestleyi ULC007 TaxID=1920490 RepID=A0A2T1DEI3_9CYAN|nr:J domain-containing protein [Phormidesmis priestleyi]PSB18851.1 J domain-containing protein [Phormidesmis priestleyi ULC007]PZO51010.1 MAG: J domain-containing protein [Phormidesmis priestleyi]
MTPSFSPDWLNKLSDPYAVLGISIVADDRRVLKRYRSVAKILHPDSYGATDPAIAELATQMFARLVSPAYQTVKQEKGRTEAVAMLRFKVRKLVRESALVPQSEAARELMRKPVQEADVFYEQAIAKLAEVQYQPLDHFETITQQISELNLVYLQLKMGDVFFTEKRQGVVAVSPEIPSPSVNPSANSEFVQPDYARRHYERSQEYVKREEWTQAISELKDAVKMQPNKAEYHALLGYSYLRQKMMGMAKAHIRRALELNPQDPLASNLAPKLKLDGSVPSGSPSTSKPPSKEEKRGGLFGIFRRQS